MLRVLAQISCRLLATRGLRTQLFPWVSALLAFGTRSRVVLVLERRMVLRSEALTPLAFGTRSGLVLGGGVILER
jgi:hypothetical protein